MISVVASSEGKMVARPLSVLVPLIKKDLEDGNRAATEAVKVAKVAGLPFFQAAGEKMIEAKAQMPQGEFTSWVKDNFQCGIRNAQLYMSFARATSDPEKRIQIREQENTSFKAAVREHTTNTNFGKPASWRKEADESIRRVTQNIKRLENENLTRQQERALEKELALQLISIGFKALASKLHPDKGGTRDAMSRLNRVRDRLKSHA